MTPPFETITIIGVGLLGGSLGLALKARGLAKTIRGVGHRRSSLEKALAVAAVDTISLDAREATEGAQVVVIGTPAGLVPQKLDEILPACSPDTVVTDVASTKAVICAHAEATWPRPLRFVGSHPMAGSEKFGPEYADADLYSSSVVVVASTPSLADDARETVHLLWRSVGARVVELDPGIHDIQVARTSHIPHILAACTAELAASAGDVGPLIGNGFRDTTRIAAGRPELWRDICLTNRGAILEGLETLGEQLEQLQRMIEERSSEALEAFFRSAREARSKALGE